MDEATQIRVRNWLKRSEEYLRAAEYEFDGEFYARAVSTAYYAMFYAATAALASMGIERAKHSGVISAFGEHFVRSGKISAELGRKLSRVMEDREESDYAELPQIDRSFARQRLDEAREFITGITRVLEQQGLVFK